MSPPPSPSGSGAQGLSPKAGLAILLLGLALLRLISAAATPLTEDEAYYRLWSQHLQLGYFDHPPMTAWWIRGGILLVGDNPLGVRLASVLASLLATLIVFDLGRMLGNERTGFRAALLYNCTLTIAAAGALAVPDAPAGLFWALTLWALAKGDGRAGIRWWVAAGAAAGLAALSKYSALFLAPGAVLWLGLTEAGRKTLARPGPWIAAAIAVGVFCLNIGWNAAHHWVTFDKQFGRAAATRFAPRYLVEFAIGQFLLLNPAVAVLAGIGAVSAWRARAMHRLPWLMLASTMPFLAYLALHSLHDRVQAHWPAPLYAGAAALAAWAVDQAGDWRAILARLAPAGLGLGVLAVAHAALPATDFGSRDPALQLRGWPAFAQAVDAVRQGVGAGWVGTLSYGVSAQLQAANPSGAPTVQINERERYEGLAPAIAPDLNRPGLIVDLDRRLDLAALRACFAQVGPVVPINRGALQTADTHYGAVRVSGPSRDLLSRGCSP
ncbi:MAG TPA: glycosyltransferase family 39 protein [Caulobacteraceae bacterium]|nr:glycosyltransferase family 39 protein [Caulobacteraceae bacterium]